MKPSPMLSLLLNFRAWLATGACKIKNYSGKVVPFEPNRHQELLFQTALKQARAGRPVRVITLKPRKIGSSTFWQCFFYYATKMARGMSAMTLAHNQDDTRTIFGIARRVHKNDPGRISNMAAQNTREFVYDHDSDFKIRTAGGAYVGSGGTLNLLQLSELGKWPGAADTVGDQLASLTTSVPDDPNTVIVIESTANASDKSGEFEGRFMTAWLEPKESDYVAVFTPWYEDQRHTSAIEVDPKNDYEKWLLDRGATKGQLAWRRKKIRADYNGQEWRFKQEFPATPQEAFQVATGKIFPMLTRQRHDIQVSMDRVRHLPKWRAIDWGAGEQHPFVCLWGCVLSDKPGFSVDTGKCPHLWKQLTSWKRDEDGRPGKLGDDGCLIAGTEVMTATGPCPIEKVLAGDTVWTDAGPCAVDSSWKTKSNAKVLRLRLEDGKTIVGTPNHPIFMADGTVLRLDAVRYGDSIATCNRLTDHERIELETAGICNAVAGSFIGSYGKNRTARFRAGSISTISTGTSSTTSRGIYESFLRRNTPGFIRNRRKGSWPQQRGCEWGLATVDGWPRGTVLMLGANGTSAMLSDVGSAKTRDAEKENAPVAALNLKRTRERTYSIHSRARPNTEGIPGSTTRRGRASGAGRISSSTDIPSVNFARLSAARAVAVEIAGRADVYNMEVVGAHRYFANGILVHNCDCARYMAVTFGITGHLHFYRELFVENAAHGGESELDLAQRIKLLGQGEEFEGSVADRSRPLSINLFAQQGISVIPAGKPATTKYGEIEDGIAYLTSMMAATQPLVSEAPKPSEIERIWLQHESMREMGLEFGETDADFKMKLDEYGRLATVGEHPFLAECY